MNALIAAQLALQLATQLQQLTALIVQARSENRDVTREELDALAGDDDAAKAALQASITRAQAAGH